MSGANPLTLAKGRCQGDIQEISMDEKMIPYFCHEGDMARAERTKSEFRQFIAKMEKM